MGDTMIVLEDDGFDPNKDTTGEPVVSPVSEPQGTGGRVVTSLSDMFGEPDTNSSGGSSHNGVWAIDVDDTEPADHQEPVALGGYEEPETVTGEPDPVEDMSDAEFQAYIESLENGGEEQPSTTSQYTPVEPVNNPTPAVASPAHTTPGKGSGSHPGFSVNGIVQQMARVLDGTSRRLFNLPGVKRFTHNLKPGTVFTRAITITVLLVLVAVGFKILGNLNTTEGVSKADATIELPDHGMLSVTQIERRDGKTYATVSNTGERVEKNISVDATGKASTLINPLTWFKPTDAGSCHGTIPMLEADQTQVVELTCDKQTTGFRVTYDVKVGADE